MFQLFYKRALIEQYFGSYCTKSFIEWRLKIYHCGVYSKFFNNPRYENIIPSRFFFSTAVKSIGGLGGHSAKKLQADEVRLLSIRVAQPSQWG